MTHQKNTTQNQLSLYLADAEDAFAVENGASAKYPWRNKKSPCSSFDDVPLRHKDLLNKHKNLWSSAGLDTADVHFSAHDAYLENMSVRRTPKGYEHSVTVDMFVYERKITEEGEKWKESSDKKRFTLFFTASHSLRKLGGCQIYSLILGSKDPTNTTPDHLAALVFSKKSRGPSMFPVVEEISDWNIEPSSQPVPRRKR